MAGIFKSLFKKDKKDKPEATTQSPQAPQPKLTKEDFETIDVLGKGSFAKVVLVRRKGTGDIYAMKVITKQGVLDHKRVGDVFTERNVLNRSDHPFLLKLHYTFQSESKLFFIMDYMPGGDLDSYLNKQPGKLLDPVTSRLYAAEVLLSIMYLHERKVIYRDLKPENILINGNGHCILADFGLSKDLYQEGVDPNDIDMRANSFVGSPFYVAPDVLKQKEYTAAVDFWSFGILLYRMLCGRPPFSGKNMKEVFDTIMYTELRFPSSVPVSAEAKDLISKLLIKDAAKRIKGPEVRAHPYWNGLNFDDVYRLRVAPPNWIPMPPLAQIVAERMAAQSAAPAPVTGGQATTGVAGAQQVVSSLATQSHLQDKQQELFTGFSYTPEALMNQQQGPH